MRGTWTFQERGRRLARPWRQGKSFIEAKVGQSLQRAALLQEVKDRLDQSTLGLSGGRQRLCPAGALAVEAEVLLMVEAAPALDPSATREIEEWIHHLKPDYTMVIIPDNMQQAARVSDVTAFFPMGRPVEANTTGTLFTRPKCRQTEDYITGRFG